MANFDWEEIQNAKERHRARLAALPPDERVRIIERLRAQGLEMRHTRVTRVPEPNPTSGATTSAAVMQLVVLGVNPTFATAVTATSNSTGAVEKTIPPL